MKRNWYIICTKAKQEKKVLAKLAQKEIECYCPFSEREVKTGTVSSIEFLPVFSTYVFAIFSTQEIQKIRRIPFVINLAHWQSEPVIIPKEEIDAIKLLEGNYINIKLEKRNVSMVEEVAVIEESIIHYSDTFVSIKPRVLKIVLPTLGYIIIAERGIPNTRVVGKKKKFSFAGLFSF